MGNRPSGPNVVAIPELGGCNRCDVSRERFDIHGALHDERLTSRFVHDDLRRKLEIMNEEHTKRSPRVAVWFVMLPLMVTGIIFFTRIRYSDITLCTGATEICNATAPNPDFAKCNRLWCCNDELEGEDYEKAGCKILPKSTIVDPEDKEFTLAEFCENEKGIPGCDCTWRRRGKNGRRLECAKHVYVEGEAENFEIWEGNLAQMMLLGQLFMQMGWILPLLYVIKKKGEQKTHLQKHFSDWKSLGISVQYFTRSKHSPGMLYLILPSAMPPTAQATLITDAKVIPEKA